MLWINPPLISICALLNSVGNVLVSFTMEGTSAGIDSALELLHKMLKQKKFSFMYYGKTMRADGVMWVDDERYVEAQSVSVKYIHVHLVIALIHIDQTQA